MAPFLTESWVRALDAAAAPIAFEGSSDLCIEHVVDAFTYHVVFASGTVRFHLGPAVNFTVRFVVDRETAKGVAQGTISAQRAFMRGVLRIEGDTMALANAQPALRQLRDVFAEVRDTTEW